MELRQFLCIDARTVPWAQGNRCLTSGAGISCIEHSNSVKDIAFSAVCNFGSVCLLHCCCQADLCRMNCPFSVSLVKGDSLPSLPLTCPYIPGSGGNYHYLLRSISAEIKQFKLALRRVTCLGTTETHCMVHFLLHSLPAENGYPLHLLSQLGSPTSKELLAGRGRFVSIGRERIFTAGMGAGAHTQEKNSSLTSTDQNVKLFNMVILVVGFEVIFPQ